MTEYTSMVVLACRKCGGTDIGIVYQDITEYDWFKCNDCSEVFVLGSAKYLLG